jgi:hypothetical protein
LGSEVEGAGKHRIRIRKKLGEEVAKVGGGGGEDGAGCCEVSGIYLVRSKGATDKRDLQSTRVSDESREEETGCCFHHDSTLREYESDFCSFPCNSDRHG